MAVTNALIKAGEKALTKGSQKAIEKATTKAVSKAVQETADKAVTKALTKGLTGAGASTMAKNAGSTLDGILGRSSGLTLPEPKITPVTLAENTAKYFPGENISTIGGMIEKFDGSNLDKIYKNGGLSKKSYDTLKAGAEEAANLAGSVYDAAGISSKSKLPKLNREQYYYDTIGKVGKKGNGNLTFEDVPDYMQSHLSNPKDAQEAFVRGGNDEILRDLFNDNESDLSDLYARYEELAQGPNSNAIYTPDNIDMGVGLMGKEGKAAEQDFSDRLFRKKKGIEVSKVSTGTKPVKVTRQEANLAPEVTGTATESANPALMDEISSMKAQLGSAGGSSSGIGGNIGGGTKTELPGSDGFNVKLKDGSTTNIKLQPEAVGSTKQQRAVRKLDDMTAKSMNANVKQYRGIVGKSGSIDGHYKTVAERMRAEKIDQANVAEKAQNALSLREAIKRQGLAYADANGVTINLSGIDNSLGMSATQKRKLAELGLSLNDMLGGATEVTPSQAEDIYKTLRDYAYNWSDSKDALTNMAGNACKKEADAVRDLIDNTMDNINVDYKTSLLEDAAKNGEDPSYLRKLAGKNDFKFSDLRKDQSDWITINDLAGNKIKDEPTLNMFGVDTGMKNPFTAGADKLKEKYYERQAYGGGTGGNFGGGSGAENTINFEDAGAGRTGTLGNILNKGKDAGLVGAGILGGLMLGGGGSQGGSGGLDGINTPPTADTAQEQAKSDPYSTTTLGGYSYDQLEAGYVAALQAGDTDAAKIIANMMTTLESKIERMSKEQESSGTASKQKAALNVLSGLMQNYEAQGPIGGRVTGLLNTLTGGGYNPAVAAYDSGSAGALGTIIKALGDTGALSEGDQKRALELLPKTTDSKEAAQYKYQQLIQILQGAGAQ